MSREKLILGGVIAGAALLWASLLWQPESPPSARSEPASHERAPAAAEASAVSRQPAVAAAATKPPAPAPPRPPEPATPAPAAAAQAPLKAPPLFAVHPMERENMKPPKEQGAVAERKRQYADESPVAGSRELEQRIADEFDREDVPPELLDAVSCRRTICQIRLRWTAVRMVPFLSVLGELRKSYDPVPAISPALEDDPRGFRPLEVYVQVKPIGEPH